jgi:hypothetical protein
VSAGERDSGSRTEAEELQARACCAKDGESALRAAPPHEESEERAEAPHEESEESSPFGAEYRETASEETPFGEDRVPQELHALVRIKFGPEDVLGRGAKDLDHRGHCLGDGSGALDDWGHGLDYWCHCLGNPAPEVRERRGELSKSGELGGGLRLGLCVVTTAHCAAQVTPRLCRPAAGGTSSCATGKRWSPLVPSPPVVPLFRG